MHESAVSCGKTSGRASGDFELHWLTSLHRKFLWPGRSQVMEVQLNARVGIILADQGLCHLTCLHLYMYVYLHNMEILLYNMVALGLLKHSIAQMPTTPDLLHFQLLRHLHQGPQGRHHVHQLL